MVVKLLESSIDLFNQELVKKESTKLDEKIKTLEEIRSIISKF